jgi:SpoVK/Ycf46/Vps4 family AAA+-type ATPase
LFVRPISIDTEGLFKFTGSTADMVIEEVSDFWKSESTYKRLQYPHKRGIILHGKPGCGKTVTVKLISKEVISRNGIVIHSEDVGAIAKALECLSDIESRRPVVVILEEIDLMLNKWGKLLTEILDGIKAQKKHVLFVATTNDLTVLPDRIKERPSRFDTVVKIALPTEDARYEYAYRITKNKKFSKEVAKKTDGLTFAHLKEVIIGCRVFKKDLVASVEKFNRKEPVGFEKPKEKVGF